MVEKDVKVSCYKKRNRGLSSAFKVEGPLCCCHDIEELFQTLGTVHIVNDWRLFIDSSKRSLKAVLLHIEMCLARLSCVRLNCLRTGVGRYHSSMYKLGLAPSPNCECGATEQSANHVISLCLLHHVPRRTRGLLVLDDATRCWLNTTTVSI